MGIQTWGFHWTHEGIKWEKDDVAIWVRKEDVLTALREQREGIAEMVRKELEKTYCELDQIESVVYEIMRYAGEGEESP